MALNFNLNESYNDFDAVVADELFVNESRILLSIDLNLQSHGYSDLAAVTVVDESSLNESRTLLSIDLNVQPSNEECIL